MRPHERLESEFAAWTGYLPACMAVCSSGTAALHLALEALRLPAGSEVIVPDYTMVACARAVVLAGLVPVFADCGPDLLIDPDAAEAAVTARTSAIMPVHVYGRRCNMVRLADLAVRNGLRIMEDLAEAHGVAPHPDTDAACWSFYRNKVIHGEEGGAIAFRDPARAALARQLRSLGFTAAHDFTHLPRGHNYRLADLLAVPILESLRDYEANVRERRRIEALYDAVCPPAWRQPPRVVPWVYDFRIRGMDGRRQDAAVWALQAAGFDARHGFKPMSSQPEFRGRWVVGAELRAHYAATEVIYLPLRPGSTPDAARAFGIVADALRH